MKKYFLTGLVTLLPLAVTIWVVVFIVRFLTKPFIGWMSEWIRHTHPVSILGTEQGIRILSQILILVGLVLVTLLLGALARRFFFRGMLKLGDRFLSYIPLVNKVYKTTKEIITALFSTGAQSFRHVVLVPFPHPDCYCLGLISGESPQVCSQSVGAEMVTVFIPTTPNPTTGYMIMMPQNALIHLEMKTEEAIKYIVSCAVVQPAAPGQTT